MSEVSYLKDDSEAKIVVKNIQENLNSMLNASDSYNPNFVACILEIGVKHAKNCHLNIESISTACLNSLQQPLGIILIEEYLIENEIGFIDDLLAPSSKKAKFSKEITNISQVNTFNK